MASQGTRRGPRGDISTEGLLRAADRVLHERGIPGLTLRAVAGEAGVTPTVLYTYFEDMADLRNRLGDDFLGRLDLSLLRADVPTEGLRRFVRHVLDLFKDSPEHSALLASQRIAGLHALRLNEALLDFFIDAVGHPPRVAAGITTFLTEWVHGKVLLSPSNPASEGFEGTLSRLDTTSFPRTMAMLSTPEDESDVVDLVLGALASGPG